MSDDKKLTAHSLFLIQNLIHAARGNLKTANDHGAIAEVEMSTALHLAQGGDPPEDLFGSDLRKPGQRGEDTDDQEGAA